MCFGQINSGGWWEQSSTSESCSVLNSWAVTRPKDTWERITNIRTRVNIFDRNFKMYWSRTGVLSVIYRSCSDCLFHLFRKYCHLKKLKNNISHLDVISVITRHNILNSFNWLVGIDYKSAYFFLPLIDINKNTHHFYLRFP